MTYLLSAHCLLLYFNVTPHSGWALTGQTVEAPKASKGTEMGRGCPLVPIMGFGERRKLPERGSRRVPAKNGFGTFLAWKNTYDGKKCLEYGITGIFVLQHIVYTRIKKRKTKPERWRSQRARGVSLLRGPIYRGCAASEVQGQSPSWEVKGRSHFPTEAKSILKRSWANRGYPKIGQSLDTSNRRLIFIKILCAYIGKDRLCDNRLAYMKDVIKF